MFSESSRNAAVSRACIALLVDNDVPMRSAAESLVLGKAQAKKIDPDEIIALRKATPERVPRRRTRP